MLSILLHGKLNESRVKEESKLEELASISRIKKYIRIIETNIEINVASTAKEKIISFYKSESGYRIVTEYR
jgi:hypothetical protein